MPNAFLFDLNRCTGCGACVLACTIQQDEPQGVNLRKVVTFNENRHPAIPVFSLSMACNHCGMPACKEYCPAAAISKDVATGAVLMDQKLCIGCKYCTWACPYDAPQYNAITGTVEKCDFCITRLRDGEEPACVCACPTNALSLKITDEVESATVSVPGFTDSQLQPAILFKRLRQQQVPLASAPPAKHAINMLFEGCLEIPPAKITLKAEWILLVFTSIAFILTAWFTAFVTRSLPLNGFVFVGLGGFGMGISTLHLGKKERAYRAILNFRYSWLSREIVLFSAFLALGGLYLFFFSHLLVLGWIALFTGFISLFAIDRLYQVALQTGPSNLHSAHVLFNGLYLAGFLTGNILIFCGAGLLKVTLYYYRKYLLNKLFRPLHLVASVARILLGFILPAVFFALQPGLPAGLIGGIATVCILIGEIIDRTEYYSELDIITPQKQMLADIQKWFKTITNK